MKYININIFSNVSITIYKLHSKWMVKTIGSISFDGSLDEFKHELFKDETKNVKILEFICSMEIGLP